MSESRKTVPPQWKEPENNLPNFRMDAPDNPKNLSVSPVSPEERYLKRKIEVTEQDHEEFLAYLDAKRVREEENLKSESASAPAQFTDVAPAKLDRRSFLTVVAGTAAVGEATALGYKIVKDQAIPSHGAKHAGDTYIEAQRHAIERELINPRADIGVEASAIGFF